MPRIITFTGASGTGKSSIVKRLLAVDTKLFRLIMSTTTREPRSTDLPGEYEHTSQEHFETMERAGEFVWTTLFVGNRYGTCSIYVDAACQSFGNSMMILVPEIVPQLMKYVGSRVAIFPFLIETPPSEILEERMLRRGDNRTTIEQRLADINRFEKEIERTSVPYIRIKNNKSLAEAVYDVRGYLR